MVSDMAGLAVWSPPFHNRSLHSSICNFLLLYDSETMPRELRLVRGMWVGGVASGGDFAPQGGRLEKPSA